MWPVARSQTDRQTDSQTDRRTHSVTTEGTLAGFQDFFLQPIIKDRPKKPCMSWQTRALDTVTHEQCIFPWSYINSWLPCYFSELFLMCPALRTNKTITTSSCSGNGHIRTSRQLQQLQITFSLHFFPWNLIKESNSSLIHDKIHPFPIVDKLFHLMMSEHSLNSGIFIYQFCRYYFVTLVWIICESCADVT